MLNKRCVSAIGNNRLGLKKGRYKKFVTQLGIVSTIANTCMRWRGSLKGLSHESGRSKSAESLGASHLERDLSIDTISSQIYLAGQSL